MSKGLTAEVARIRALARMAREEGISELSVEGATFKLEPVQAPPDKPVVTEEVEPVEALSREFEESTGMLVDREALRAWIIPQKKGRTPAA